MGQSSKTITALANGDRVVASIPLERNYLVAVSANSQDPTLHESVAFARIGISLNSDTPQNAILVLAEGYIDSSAAIHWSGRIALKPSMRVTLEVWSIFASVFSLNTLTEE
jgi:hypothetical protein